MEKQTLIKNDSSIEADVSINETGKRTSRPPSSIDERKKHSRVYTSETQKNARNSGQYFRSRTTAYKALNEISAYGRKDSQWNSSGLSLGFWEEWLGSEVTPSKTEPFDKFKKRVWSIVRRFAKAADSEIVIVGHLGVLRPDLPVFGQYRKRISGDQYQEQLGIRGQWSMGRNSH